jgi:hypothetical protein
MDDEAFVLLQAKKNTKDIKIMKEKNFFTKDFLVDIHLFENVAIT